MRLAVAHGLLGGFATAAAFACGPDIDALTDGQCEEGLKACDGDCVPTDEIELGCAAEGCFPCQLDNASPICSPTGECKISICSLGFTDCNGDSRDGCEVETDFDVNNCAQCGRSCPPGIDHEPTCSAGACVVGVCHVPLANCNNISSDGCEIDLSTDRDNCGACKRACADGMVCNGDAADPECVTG